MGTEGDQSEHGLSERLILWFKKVLKSFQRHDTELAQNMDALVTGKDSESAPHSNPTAQAEPVPTDPPVAEPTVRNENVPEGEQESITMRTENPETASAESVPINVVEPAKATWQTNPAVDSWYPTRFKNRLSAIKYHQYQDNYGIERRAANGWHIVGATRRGKKHAHDATYREDAFADETTDKFTILCVADGAGAYPYSRIGSQYAANELVHHLSSQVVRGAEKQSLREPVQFRGYLAQQLEKSIHHVINSLVKYAEKNEVSPKDFRCTLLTALFYHDEKHQVVLLNQIGDGAICTYNKATGETRKIGGEGESGSHSGEVSRFVPDKASKKMEFHVLPDSRMKEVDCLMLCSDGIEDPFYPMEKNSAHIFRQFYHGVKKAELADMGITQVEQPHVFSHPTEGASLESWLTFDKKGESDDRTLLVMFRGEG